MERDVSLLRCSKLSCYSEFNRMVQAIARNGGEGDITTIPGTRPQTGTSAEYNFYTTLVLMLKQVIRFDITTTLVMGLNIIRRNRDSLTQKRELQRVYEWFCLNKPLIRSKTKPTQRKPKLSITTAPEKTDRAASAVPFPFLELDRPQTAPASLYQPHRFSGGDAGILRGSDREKSSPPKRRSTFTAMYISRSLSRGMDLIGQPLDQLQLQQKRSTVPSKSQERISISREKVVAMDDNAAVAEGKGAAINVIDFPSSDFPTHQWPDTAESAVSLATVFSMVPGVAAQMILEKELNEHFESNRKRALSFHTTQTMRIGSDYQPTNRRLVNTPTDGATVEPFLMKRYSVADTLGTSERVNQQRVGHGVQASPRYQQRAIKEYRSPQSEIRAESNEATTTDQSSNSVEDRIQATDLPSEAQEMMLDMKAVDSRTSALSLSQISLKQKDSPRTKHKQNSHNIDTVSHLQIEGQGVKQTSSETAKLSPRLASSAAAAAQREQRINSPRSSTRVAAHEAKSSGSLASLLIRPVSLQHHSAKPGATSRVNQEGERDGDRNLSIEKPGDTDDTGESKDTAAPGDSVSSNENHVTADSEATARSPEGSPTRPGEKDLPTKSQDEGATSQNKLIESESQNIAEEESTSADCIKEGREDGETSPQKKEFEDLQATSGGASGLTKELTETSSSISQDQPLDSHDSETPKSPVVVIKASPTLARPHSNRPSSSSHKSRLLSPMNVVSLSFPSDKLGNRQQANRQATTAEAGRKTPTIIAGFNRKRYRRLKSSPATCST